MANRYTALMAILSPLREAQYDWDRDQLRRALSAVMAPGALVRLCHPFGDLHGPEAFCRGALDQLHTAMPDVERRDWIVIAGTDDDGADWVGCGGHYAGVFAAPFLGILPTGHVAHMRFHEFYRIEDGKIVEVQAIWDIPELMMQAGVWPMAPSLGREMTVFGPASGDGLHRAARDQFASAASHEIVVDMLTHMVRHPLQGGPEVMQMERFWHPRMTWYGPAGIGTARGIDGFRNWHQIPFLTAMPDRGQYPDATRHHFFADNAYVGVTGWPNMSQTLTGGGWMGLPPTEKRLEMRSLDFWRLEDGLIRENWVLVDLLHVYDQLGVDVLGRMKHANRARAVRFDAPLETT